MKTDDLLALMAAIIYAGEEGCDPTDAVKDAYELLTLINQPRPAAVRRSK